MVVYDSIVYVSDYTHHNAVLWRYQQFSLGLEETLQIALVLDCCSSVLLLV